MIIEYKQNIEKIYYTKTICCKTQFSLFRCKNIACFKHGKRPRRNNGIKTVSSTLLDNTDHVLDTALVLNVTIP